MLNMEMQNPKKTDSCTEFKGHFHRDRVTKSVKKFKMSPAYKF